MIARPHSCVMVHYWQSAALTETLDERTKVLDETKQFLEVSQENYNRLSKQLREVRSREEEMLRQIAQAEQNMEQVRASFPQPRLT
jgi:hypothetical protein